MSGKVPSRLQDHPKFAVLPVLPVAASLLPVEVSTGTGAGNIRRSDARSNFRSKCLEGVSIPLPDVILVDLTKSAVFLEPVFQVDLSETFGIYR